MLLDDEQIFNTIVQMPNNISIQALKKSHIQALTHE